jgi:hypothetical protein
MNNQFKPILFSTQMVQAILEGRKTQTRRVINNIHPDSEFHPDLNLLGYTFVEPDGKIKVPEMASVIQGKYKVGDVLWVREKFRRLVDCRSGRFHSFEYYADMPEAFHKQFPHKWKPSIHMPKAACRLFLEITNVRVERLHDISEEDAIAEGVNYVWYDEKRNIKIQSAKSLFNELWSSINGADSWNANPWVWVVEFKRIENPVNF